MSHHPYSYRECAYSGEESGDKKIKAVLDHDAASLSASMGGRSLVAIVALSTGPSWPNVVGSTGGSGRVVGSAFIERIAAQKALVLTLSG
jgi:hypothetical protein